MQTHILLAQAFALLSFLVHRIAACLLYLPYAVLRCSINSLRKRNGAVEEKGCTFYEGTVFHERRKPVHNAFRCTHLSCCCDSAMQSKKVSATSDRAHKDIDGAMHPCHAAQ